MKLLVPFFILLIFQPLIADQIEDRFISNPVIIRGRNSYLLDLTLPVVTNSFCLEYLDQQNIKGRFKMIGDFRLSRLFLFSTSFHFITALPGLTCFNFTWKMKPLKFLYFFTGYQLRNYLHYHVLEHNVYFFSKISSGLFKFFTVYFMIGINLRLAGINDLLSNKTIGSKWLYTTVLCWQTGFKFNIRDKYAIGVEVGNIFSDEIMSLGYLQFELINLISINRYLVLCFNTGLAFSGALSLAGYINHIWGEMSVKVIL
ncbi:MAG: hypothetical protein MJB14_07000 [Spirochaetes bacterium]|nr:hypothetical protein [Spirochaetota bacterium]